MIMWTAACRCSQQCIPSVCAAMKESDTRFRMKIDQIAVGMGNGNEKSVAV
jgi:hypothetical protein